MLARLCVIFKGFLTVFVFPSITDTVLSPELVTYNKLELSLIHLAEREETPFAVLKEMKDKLPEKELPKEEIDDIIEFFSKEFGLVSDNSKKKIQELVKRMGVFHFTITMMKALPGFKRDLVYHFLKEVEQAGDCL